MNKILCTTTGMILITLLLTQNVVAQTSSTYIIFKPVYAFAGNSSKLNETTAITQGVTYTTGVYGSYGRGLGFQLGIGKMINPNFGVELTHAGAP